MDMISELICCLMERITTKTPYANHKKKKFTKHRKAINFFLPSSKGREREKK